MTEFPTTTTTNAFAAPIPPAPGTLFLGTTYHICSSLPPSIQEGLESILSANGGRKAHASHPSDPEKNKRYWEDPKLNIIITRSEKFEGWEEVVRRNRERGARVKAREVKGKGREGEEEVEEIHVVTPIWADRSVVLAKKQFPHHFSVLPSMIFSGVSACACSATIPAQDVETLAAGITALGGQWRAHLTGEVTHLFVLNPMLNLDVLRTGGVVGGDKAEEGGNGGGNEEGVLGELEKEAAKEREKEKEKERQLALLLDISPKYTTAMHFKHQTGIKVVLPHWFDDCVKMGRRVDERPYEWPDVRVLRGTEGIDPITGNAIVVPELMRNGKEAKDKERKEREAKERERERERAAMGEEEREKEAIRMNVYTTAAMFTPALEEGGVPDDADLSLMREVEETVVLGGAPNLAVGDDKKKKKYSLSAIAALAPLVSASNGQESEGGKAHHQVWAGRRILLSRTLKLYGARRDAVQAQIERAGGVVVRYDGDGYDPTIPGNGKDEAKAKDDFGRDGIYEVLSKDEKERRKREAEKVGECDVLVTRWRDGRAYVEAVRSLKTIGTLAWFFHVQSTGLFARPLDQLLHYPTPKRQIEGFGAHVVTVTNYTGEAREYIKKLINAMGGKFTPSMSGTNTALVAAYISGTKANKALSWQIPVVNHTWLEDCFAQWRNLTPARPKYITFPPGVDFSKMLGERGVPTGLAGMNVGSGAAAAAQVNSSTTTALGGIGLVGNTRFVDGIEAEGQVETEEEVLGKIEREAEDLLEAIEMQEEEEEEEERLRLQEKLGPRGTEDSMREVSEDLIVGDGVARGDEFDFDSDPGATMDMDFTINGPGFSPRAERDDEDEGGVGKTSTPRKREAKEKEQVKGGEKENKLTQTKMRSQVKSSSVVPGSSSPVKAAPSTKHTKKNKGEEEEEVIELEDSSDDDDDKGEVNLKSMSKSKSKTKAISIPTPSKKNLAEVVLTANAKKRKVVADISISGDDDDNVDDSALHITPKKSNANAKSTTRNKNPIPQSSPLSEPTSASSPPKKVAGRRKLIRRLTRGATENSSMSAIGGGDENANTETGAKEKENEKEKPRRVLVKRAAGLAKAKEDENVEETVEERPRKKAKMTVELPRSKPAPAPTPSTSGILSKLTMAKADARTRVKKKNPNAPTKKVEVESEDEEVEVVSKTKGKGKASISEKETGKVKGKKGKKVQSSDEEDEKVDEEAEEEEEGPAKLSKSKSSAKSRTSAKSSNKVDSEPELKSKSKSAPTKTETRPSAKSTSKLKSGKPLRVYSPDVPSSDDSESDDAKSDENDDDEEDEKQEDSDDSDDLPSDPLRPTKAELRAMEKEKERARKAKEAEKLRAKEMLQKGKGKAKVVQEEDGEGEEELPKTRTKAKEKEKEQERAKVDANSRSKATTVSAKNAKKTTAKRAHTPTPPASASESASGSDSDSDSDDEPPPPRRRKTTTPTTTKTTKAAASSSSKAKKPDDVLSERAAKTPLKRVLSVLLPSLMLSPKKAGMKGKSPKIKEQEKEKEKEKEKAVSISDTEEDDQDEKEQEQEVVKPRSRAKTNANGKAPAPTSKKTTKASAKRHATETDEDEDEVSAIVVADANISPRAKRALIREESIRADFGQVQVPVASSSVSAKVSTTTAKVKAGGSKTKASTSMPPPPVPASRAAAPEPQSQSQLQSQSQSTSGRLSNRSAAVKATQKLHDSIMPDVLQYEAQLAKSKSKARNTARGQSRMSDAFVVEGDSLDVGKKGKRKGGEDEGEGDEGERKKRRVSAGDGDDDGEVGNGEVKRKAKKGKWKGKKVQRDEEEGAMDVDDGDDDDGNAKLSSSKPLPGEGIMIMTTQVQLSEDVVKTLTKLGMKITTRPNECTHLIAPHVVRTEKFLCALASRAPHVLTREWAEECAKAGKVLPEGDYPLPDSRAEDNKYHVDLGQSIRRAREIVDTSKNKDKSKKKLLEGHTFYVTPRVPVDTKLLKNVVVACGGQVSSQPPTHRIISAAPETRHVISCPEDISIWRPIHAGGGTKIYTQELVLTGVLGMEMDWDGEEYAVKA